MDRHPNWIDGAPCPSREGLFELFARDGSARRLGEWPLSGAREVVAALEALSAGSDDDEPARRSRSIVQVRSWPEPGETRAADMAARLALNEAEFGRLMGARTTFGLGLEPRPAGRLVLFSAGRRMWFPELLRRLVGLRLEGARVLVIASRELPQVADTAREALQTLGLGGRGLALLHGLTPAGWRELGAPETVRPAFEVRGRLDADVRAELEGSALREPGLAATLTQLGAPAELRFELGDFARGAGLGLEGLSRKSARPRLDLLAERLVEHAFGRVPGLAGLAHRVPLAGAVEVGFYAAFVDATLAAMERLAAREAPLPALGGLGMAERYRTRWRAALDEGGVLLTGGQTTETAAGPILAPTLLVNLPRSGLAIEAGEPLAQLRLARLRKRP